MVGIVIVTYNSLAVIGRCLDACLRVDGANVVVVDNASEDNTLDEVRKRPAVASIANSINRGFAAAVNQGFRKLRTETVLVLNPDTVLAGGLAELQLAVTSNPDVGAATGRLLNGNGSSQHGFNVRTFPTPVTLVFELLGVNRLIPWNAVNRRYRVRIDSDTPVDIEQPAGAFLMIRREAWEAIGGFDERFYPVWFEDVDFCKRLRDRGFRIWYVPAATAEHAGGHSVAGLSWAIRQEVWYGSLLRYASKHFSTLETRAVAVAVLVGCVARTIGRTMAQLSLEPFTVCSRVVRLTGLYLLQGERGCQHKESKSRF